MKFFSDKSTTKEDKRTLTEIYEQASESDLRNELHDSLEMYPKFELDGPLEPHKHFGLHEETVLTRASIHDTIVELKRRNIDINVDAQKVQKLEQAWQNWISHNTREDFKLVDLNRDDEPKEHWWYWIDELTELTSVQKNTV